MLQFKIRDIHIRYEDSISIPGQIFACGITLGSLNTNASDLSSSTNNGTCTSAKTMELQALAIYWDAIDDNDLLGNKTLGELAVNIFIKCVMMI